MSGLVLGRYVDAGGMARFVELSADELGRLMVAAQPVAHALVTGVINAVDGQVAVDVSRVSNVVATVNASALVGHNCTFEGSLDSTNGINGNWFALQATRSNANMVATSTGNLSATPSYAWKLSVNGVNWLRVRATAHTSGDALWSIQKCGYVTEPSPTSQANNITTFYNDTATPLTAGATLTGSARDLGQSPQTAKRTFATTAYADQAGTLYIDMSNDNITWRQAKKAAVAAGDSAELQVLSVTRYYRTRFVNGATAQGAFMLNSGIVGA